MAELTKRQAAEIIGKYLSMGIEDALEDQIPEDVGYYSRCPPTECWFYFVPSNFNHIGASRLIVVSKMMGEIAFDGMVGE